MRRPGRLPKPALRFADGVKFTPGGARYKRLLGHCVPAAPRRTAGGFQQTAGKEEAPIPQILRRGGRVAQDGQCVVDEHGWRLR